MHGTLQMVLNRKGRKRKSRKGSIAAYVPREKIDHQGFVEDQPHRKWLPESLRGHEKAENVLGCLNLLGQVSDEAYEAGRRFAVIVGSFRQVIEAPRGTVGGGRGYSCRPSFCAAFPENCTCESRTAKYRDACAYLQSAGQRAYNVTYQVVVSEIRPTLDQMPQLIWGLNALARAFGLTNHRKS